MPPLVTQRADQQAVKLFERWIRQLKPARAFVQQWQVAELVPLLDQLSTGRSFTKGQLAYRDTGCVQCHRLGDEGGTVGPDLKGIAMPRSVAATKTAVANAISTSRPALLLPPACEAKSKAIPLEGGGPPVGTHAFARTGGEARTFAGLAGLGDLLATCVSPLSRNRSVGEQLGKGRKLGDIVGEMRMVAEGVHTCRLALELGRRHGVEMPITREIDRVVRGEATALEAYRGLVRRPPGLETD